MSSRRAAAAADLEQDAYLAASPADPSDDSLSSVADRLRSFRATRDWERFHTPRNLAMSIAIECGELLEHFQWVDDRDIAEHVIKHESSVAEELADVAIYVVQLADVLGIPLHAAIEAKIARNEERYPAELARGNAAKHTALKGRRRLRRPSEHD